MDLDAATLRVFLHVLAASVWVGGQITLAALVPVLRTLGDDAPKKAANGFNRIAWPFFALALVTGIWNVIERDPADASTSWNVGLLLKLLIVAFSGVAAFLHANASTRTGMAVWGAATGASALLALLFGAMLQTSF